MRATPPRPASARAATGRSAAEAPTNGAQGTTPSMPHIPPRPTSATGKRGSSALSLTNGARMHPQLQSHKFMDAPGNARRSPSPTGARRPQSASSTRTEVTEIPPRPGTAVPAPVTSLRGTRVLGDDDLSSNSSARLLPARDDRQMSSQVWLEEHSLHAQGLTMKQILARVGFSHCKASEDLAALVSTGETHARYCHGLFNHYRFKDGTMKHVYITEAQKADFEMRIERNIADYKRRLRWLKSGSRAIFGALAEPKVAIVVDASGLDREGLTVLKQQLHLLLEEQLHTRRAFNLIAYGGEVNTWRPKATMPDDLILRSASAWIENLRPGDGNNALKALTAAFTDSSLDAIYLVARNVPGAMGGGDGITPGIVERVVEMNDETGIAVHTVAYGIAPGPERDVLRMMASLTGGRFHCYAEIVGGEEDLASIAEREGTIGGTSPGNVRLGLDTGAKYAELTRWVPQGDDLELLREEIRRGKDVIERIHSMRGEYLETVREKQLRSQRMSPSLTRSGRFERHELDAPVTSSEWLATNGIHAQKLTVYDALAGCAFRHCDSARYCDGLTHFVWKDGTLVHVYVTDEAMTTYERRIGELVTRMRQRADWLREGSREVFGALTEEKVTVIIDTSGSMQPRMAFLRQMLARLLDEQLCRLKRFNLIQCSTHASAWSPVLLPPTVGNVEAAREWISRLEAGGSTNAEQALEMAFSDDDVEGIYFLTDGRPNQPEEAVMARVRELSRERNVPVHTISFHIADDVTEAFLRRLAGDTGGRYQVYSVEMEYSHPERPTEGSLGDQPIPGIFPSPLVREPIVRRHGDDVRAILEEMAEAKRSLEQVRALRAACVNRGEGPPVEVREVDWVENEAATPPMDGTRLDMSLTGKKLLDRRGSPTKGGMGNASASAADSRPPFSVTRPRYPIQGDLKDMVGANFDLAPLEAARAREVSARKKMRRKAKAARASSVGMGSRGKRAGVDESRMSSADWIAMYGLEKRRLNVFNVISGTSFSHRTTYVPSIDRHVCAKYCDDVFSHYQLVNGEMRHVHPAGAKLVKYERRLSALRERIVARLELLRSPSRAVVGTVTEEKVVFLLDASTGVEGFDTAVVGLKRTLKEQFHASTEFDVVVFGDVVRACFGRLTRYSQAVHATVVDWLRGVRPSGRRNLLQAFRVALTIEGADSVYFILGGKTELSAETLIEEIRQMRGGRQLRVHGISFNCLNAKANDTLHRIAKEFGGRFHSFSSVGKSATPLPEGNSDDSSDEEVVRKRVAKLRLRGDVGGTDIKLLEKELERTEDNLRVARELLTHKKKEAPQAEGSQNDTPPRKATPKAKRPQSARAGTSGSAQQQAGEGSPASDERHDSDGEKKEDTPELTESMKRKSVTFERESGSSDSSSSSSSSEESADEDDARARAEAVAKEEDVSPRKPLEFVPGQRVIARKPLTGFYYCGTVSKRKGAAAGKDEISVEFDDGERIRVSPFDAMQVEESAANAARRLKTGDRVLARAPDAEEYRPGIVTLADAPYSKGRAAGRYATVVFFDDVRADVNHVHVFPLSAGTHGRVCAYILSRMDAEMQRVRHKMEKLREKLEPAKDAAEALERHVVATSPRLKSGRVDDTDVPRSPKELKRQDGYPFGSDDGGSPSNSGNLEVAGGSRRGSSASLEAPQPGSRRGSMDAMEIVEFPPNTVLACRKSDGRFYRAEVVGADREGRVHVQFASDPHESVQPTDMEFIVPIGGKNARPHVRLRAGDKVLAPFVAGSMLSASTDSLADSSLDVSMKSDELAASLRGTLVRATDPTQPYCPATVVRSQKGTVSVLLSSGQKQRGLGEFECWPISNERYIKMSQAESAADKDE